jgi:dimethylsulfone monooxygenase
VINSNREEGECSQRQKRARSLRVVATNPLFNDRKLKFGTFSSNLGHGCAISTIEGTLKVSWPTTLELGRLADEMEFEALVPVGRWKGFGGETNFNGPGFECFTWAAGMAGATKYSSVFATSHVPTIHPCLAAKQVGTIDHISNGRFALNVVCGWFRSEIEMFGMPMLDHDRRYDMAEEWLDILKLMWVSEGEFDFEGSFYKVNKGYMEPKPIQQPFPPIMNAVARTGGAISPPKTATSLSCSSHPMMRRRVALKSSITMRLHATIRPGDTGLDFRVRGAR